MNKLLCLLHLRLNFRWDLSWIYSFICFQHNWDWVVPDTCRYFETLQKGLELYDCVLYEMVTSRDNLENRRNSVSTKNPRTSRSKGFNILGFIQRQMAQILSLDFQLDCLNYEGENWHHADLDYETFKLLQVLCLSLFLPIVCLFLQFLPHHLVSAELKFFSLLWFP